MTGNDNLFPPSSPPPGGKVRIRIADRYDEGFLDGINKVWQIVLDRAKAGKVWDVPGLVIGVRKELDALRAEVGNR